MGNNNDSSKGIGTFSIQDIIQGIWKTEFMPDSTLVQGAKVICTACGAENSNSSMIKGASLLLLQKSLELGHKDINFFPWFDKCMAGDHICKPQIEGGQWQDYDEKKVTDTGDYSVLINKSYMLCTKGFGVIYATDTGQRIDARQFESTKLLMRRWWNNPLELGFLKGISLHNAYSKDPVNLNTGNFIYQHEDLKISGTMPLIFKRFYNAMDTRAGRLGPGWTHNFEMHLKKNKNKLTLFLDDGKEGQYIQVSERLYRNHQSGLETIEVIKKGNQITYIYKSLEGCRHLFNQDGQEFRREDSNGNHILLHYNQDRQLIEAESYGSKLFFWYDDQGQLVRLSDHTQRELQFEYQEDFLVMVKMPDGNSIKYSYGTNQRIQAITNARGIQSVYNEYDEHFRTIKQNFPDQGEVIYAYHDSDNMVEMTEQNGNCVKHYYDQQYRNVKTVYEDGYEEFVYNEQNKKTRYKDKCGYITRYEYDHQGNEIRVIDALGNRIFKSYNQNNKLLTLSVNRIMKIKNQYDNKGNLLKTMDGIQRSIEFSYNHQGKPVEFIQPDGSKYTFEYDQRGNLMEVTDPGAYQVVYQYDQLNRVTETIDANGNHLCYEYDEMNNVTAVVNARGEKRCYTYNESNKLTSFADYDGSIRYYEYGVLNKPVKTIDAMGNETVMEYDLMWNLCKVKDPNGGVTSYTYNHLNQLESVTNPLAGTTRYEYDGNGNRTKSIGCNGAVSEYDYDALNRVIQVRDPGGAVHSYEYNSDSQITKYIDPLNQITIYEYDAAGQKLKEIDSLGVETCFVYNSLGRLIQVNKAGYQLVEYQYDSRGLRARECHLDGSVVCYCYDGNQNLVKKTDQNGYILEYEYDGSSRVIRVWNNHGSESSYCYDPVGNLIEAVNANGNKSKYLYDPSGNLIGVIDSEGNHTAYGYDGTGNLTHIVQGSKPLFTDESSDFDILEIIKRNKESQELRVTVYQRNFNGQIEKEIDSLGNIENYQYNSGGKLIHKNDGDGYQTAYAYNADGDLNQISYSDGRMVKFCYNPLRQLMQFEDWLGITRIESDALGRAIKVNDHKGREVAYEWGDLNERKRIIYPDGKTVSYEYDDHLYLKQVRRESTKVDYYYGDNGYLKEKAYHNGLKTTYDYDQSGRLDCLTHWNRSSKMDEYHYAYDSMGNKVKIQKQRNGAGRESGCYQYRYDALNRISKVIKDGHMVREYQYDRYGNRTGLEEGSRSTKYLYNPLNQLVNKIDIRVDKNQGTQTRMSEELYTYDKRGNLTERYRDGILMNQYHFGALNRLEAAVNCKTGLAARYTYNGFGQRTGRVEGQMPEIALPTAKLDQINILPTRQIDDIMDMTKQYHNTLQRYENENVDTFIWDHNIVSVAGTDNKDQFYFHDELGSPIRVMDQEGTLKEVYGYDEFGNNLSGNQGQSQPFGYTGYQPDDITGTLFAQMRQYDPASGRFISQDPIKYKSNWYSYCSGNSLNFIDPMGLCDEELSEGAQAYINYYEDIYKKFEIQDPDAVQSIFNGAIRAVFDGKQNDIRLLDSKGQIQSNVLNVPVYNQLDVTELGNNNNLCWATSSAMWISYLSGDTTDRTLDFAGEVLGSDDINVLNAPQPWHSTDGYPDITASQVQTLGNLSATEVQSTIDSGSPFGVLYRDSNSGHWIVGTGYHSAPGHPLLVVSNDPWGGVQRVQTYDEFQTLPDGRVWEWTSK